MPAPGGATTKVATVSANKPGQLVFLVPAGMASGEYSLQVRTRNWDSGDIRTGTLDFILSVPWNGYQGGADSDPPLPMK